MEFFPLLAGATTTERSLYSRRVPWQKTTAGIYVPPSVGRMRSTKNSCLFSNFPRGSRRTSTNYYEMQIFFLPSSYLLDVSINHDVLYMSFYHNRKLIGKSLRQRRTLYVVYIHARVTAGNGTACPSSVFANQKILGIFFFLVGCHHQPTTNDHSNQRKNKIPSSLSSKIIYIFHPFVPFLFFFSGSTRKISFVEPKIIQSICCNCITTSPLSCPVPPLTKMK